MATVLRTLPHVLGARECARSRQCVDYFSASGLARWTFCNAALTSRSQMLCEGVPRERMRDKAVCNRSQAAVLRSCVSNQTKPA